VKPAEFQECVSQLKAAFGEKSYPDIRVQGLWKALQMYPDGVLGTVVEKLVVSARSAPLYGDLKEACDFEIRNRKIDGPKLVHKDCAHCGGSGAIEMIGYLNDERITAFGTCDECELGRSHRGKASPTVAALKRMGWEVRRVRANIPAVEGMAASLTAICWNMHKAILDGKPHPDRWHAMLKMMSLTEDEAWEAYELEWKRRMPGRISDKCKQREPGAIHEMGKAVP
jgi:hypothetical protein